MYSKSATLRLQVESALAGRMPSPFRLPQCEPPNTVPVGIPLLDEVTGGLPRGGITELYGPACSGKTALLQSALAARTANSEVCALVDAHDSFDPICAQSSGVALRQLLWVRCKNLDQAFRSVDVLLHALGESAIGRTHAGEQRVAADFRHGLGAQDGAKRRRLAEGLVDMPDVGQRRRIFVGIVEDDDFRLVYKVGREGMDRELAEQRAERHLLVDRDVLVAQHDHFVLDQRVVDDLELRGTQRLPEIDALDFSADEAVDGLYADFRRGALAYRRRLAWHASSDCSLG